MSFLTFSVNCRGKAVEITNVDKGPRGVNEIRRYLPLYHQKSDTSEVGVPLTLFHLCSIQIPSANPGPATLSGARSLKTCLGEEATRVEE